ncbi:hypothetical protein LARV_01877 [Longilinea arvoryzae]|uniref:Glycosyltransferase RgtA/B/C/D-like domain-containing protein n=1 Tax=Longilinea arvoryzae TaxID=360412 RepID=A0A0S7BIV3_9CHLR|nr:hypothetical protein [Longilinea arvoryzae]GAP14114.1 hypothetical protein LARV_01877 [Longilinea arvoryzae]
MKQTRKNIANLYPYLGLFLLLAGGLAAFFLLPYSIWGDGSIRFQFMDSLVHDLRIDPMRYSMIGPLFSIPLWWISALFSNPVAVIERYNFLLFAAGLVILYRWLKDRYDRKFLLTFGLLLSFGSMIPNHLTSYYGEVFSAVFMTLGTAGIVTGRSRPGWIFLILAVLNTPALMIPFALVVGYLTWESRQLRYLSLIPICLVLMVGESFLRTGSLLAGFQTYLAQDHGYQTVLPYSGRTGYSYPFGLGILSILFSFGKGIFLFCPGLLLVVWALKSISNPSERRLLTLWLLIVLGLILAYAPWWAWYGGWFWGPRFFLFASVPASWMLAKLFHSENKSLPMILVLLILISGSLWVGVDGVVFQQKMLETCTANNYALESLCWYVPEFSPLIRPWITHATLSLNDRLSLILFGVIWFYLIAPVSIDLLSRLKSFYSSFRSRGYLSNWKL